LSIPGKGFPPQLSQQQQSFCAKAKSVLMNRWVLFEPKNDIFPMLRCPWKKYWTMIVKGLPKAGPKMRGNSRKIAPFA
jgi:hypothetical protein